MAFQLLIARGNSEGRQYVVVQPVIRIGRADDNDVVLSDAGVSRTHTRIFENFGRPWVEDLGSATGTLVNGERVAAPRELKNGDALAIGSALISFLEIDERKSAPRVVPSIAVKSKEITGENKIPEDELVTASGEESQAGLLYDKDDAEVTAPVGRPLFSDDKDKDQTAAKGNAFAADDSTQPVGKPLKLVPDAPHGGGMTATAPALTDPRRAPAPNVPTDAVGALVPSSVLRRPPDVAKSDQDQRTTLAVPDAEAEKKREGPTRIVAPLGVVTDLQPSINRLLRDEPSDPSGDSLQPLELSKSDFKAINDATVADAKPLTEPPVSLPSLPAVEAPSAPAVPAVKPAPRHATDALPKETAAERMRKRRQANATLGDQALAWWKELPTRTQAILTAVSAAIVTTVLIGLFQVFRPEVTNPLPPEPDRLLVGAARIPHTFGLGDGVDYSRPDLKDFAFELITPTEAAILLHYQAQEIDRDEVVIVVNGAEVGFVPPDIGVPDREIETLVPQRLLKRGAKNTLVFDNVKNPPGSQRWRVGQIWLELLPVPPSTSKEAIRRARDLAKQAGQLYAQREVGAENVFKAWKAYRQAWQQLLVVPEEERGVLFDQTRRKGDEIGQELDRQCGQLMLDAKKQMELKNLERAKEILLEVQLWFPTTEHRCHGLANEKLDEYQL